MSNHKKEAPITIIFHDDSGVDDHLDVISEEAQAEVRALAERLKERWRERGEQVMSMDDALR
jgi:hypothetical protein